MPPPPQLHRIHNPLCLCLNNACCWKNEGECHHKLSFNNVEIFLNRLIIYLCLLFPISLHKRYTEIANNLGVHLIFHFHGE